MVVAEVVVVAAVGLNLVVLQPTPDKISAPWLLLVVAAALSAPASGAVEDSFLVNTAKSLMYFANPRGRMDTYGWGGTLYRYRSEAAVEAIAAYSALAKRAGISLADFAWDLLWEIDRVHMRNRLPIFSSKHVDSSHWTAQCTPQPGGGRKFDVRLCEAAAKAREAEHKENHRAVTFRGYGLAHPSEG
eukprot:s2657_g3.t1